jgi:hypothetical protein
MYVSMVIMLVLSAVWFGGVQAQEQPQDGDQSNYVYIPLIVGGHGHIPPTDLGQLALELVAARNNLAADELMIAHSATSEYLLQGKIASNFKVMDQQSGATYGVTLDVSGQELAVTQLEAEERAAYEANFGRLSPALTELLASAPDSESIPVIIWLKEPPYVGLERPAPRVVEEVQSQSEVEDEVQLQVDGENEALAQSGVASDTLPDSPGGDETISPSVVAETPDVISVPIDAETLRLQQEQRAFLAQVDTHRSAAVALVTAPLVNRLQELGYVAVSDRYAPVLYAHLPASAIRQIAAWNEVDRVYLEPIVRPMLNIARSTIRAHTVHNRGNTGAGIQVAQIDVGGGIATDNPYLAGVIQDTTFVCPAAHSTWVAGIIRSRLSSLRGIAPGVTLWAGGSCSGSVPEIQDRSSAAADWGAQVLNLSLGYNSGLIPDDFARFYDNMVLNRARTVVVAAGNYGQWYCNDERNGSGNVASPALAYNVIAVGDFNDKNTSGWAGDAMNPCSSWRDPNSLNGDREKPEVAAPGTNIRTTTTSNPWVTPSSQPGVTGTSFAAPMVTGVAALLIKRDSVLAVWPEIIKAIIMAAAVHNIEGGLRLSEYDGVGGIDADRADNVTRGVSGNWDGQRYDCSTPNPLDVTTMSLTGGKRTRVVIAWDNDPAYDPAYNSAVAWPGADLDLHVLSPSGSDIAYSVSYDNTYEIVDFTPSGSGNYTLRIYRFRCNYSPRYLGWAWLQI